VSGRPGGRLPEVPTLFKAWRCPCSVVIVRASASACVPVCCVPLGLCFVGSGLSLVTACNPGGRCTACTSRGAPAATCPLLHSAPGHSLCALATHSARRLPAFRCAAASPGRGMQAGARSRCDSGVGVTARHGAARPAASPAAHRSTMSSRAASCAKDLPALGLRSPGAPPRAGAASCDTAPRWTAASHSCRAGRAWSGSHSAAAAGPAAAGMPAGGCGARRGPGLFLGEAPVADLSRERTPRCANGCTNRTNSRQPCTARLCLDHCRASSLFAQIRLTTRQQPFVRAPGTAPGQRCRSARSAARRPRHGRSRWGGPAAPRAVARERVRAPGGASGRGRARRARRPPASARPPGWPGPGARPPGAAARAAAAAGPARPRASAAGSAPCRARRGPGGPAAAPARAAAAARRRGRAGPRPYTPNIGQRRGERPAMPRRAARQQRHAHAGPSSCTLTSARGGARAGDA
jgi:hypothetical protein